MLSRREKKEEQEKGKRRRSVKNLIEDNILRTDDIVIFNEDKVPDETNGEYDEEDDFWRARVTGKTVRSDNFEWLHDGGEYSVSGLTRNLLHELVGRPQKKRISGYPYWCHPKFDYRTLDDLRKSDEKTLRRAGEV
jgi:hypothetical protein